MTIRRTLPSFRRSLAGLRLKERYIRSYGNSYEVSSPDNRRLMTHLAGRCRQHNIMLGIDSVFSWIADFPTGEPLQPELF